MASEAGVLPIPEEKIVKKWRLQAGQDCPLDVERGRIVDDKELKETLPRRSLTASGSSASASGSTTWRAKNSSRTLGGVPARSPSRRSAIQEDLKFLMLPMATAGEEAIAPWATTRRWRCCRARTRPCTTTSSSCLPGDQSADRPDREDLVMSLVSFIGPSRTCSASTRSILRSGSRSASRAGFYEMDKIRHIDRNTEGKFRSFELDITYPVVWGTRRSRRAWRASPPRPRTRFAPATASSSSPTGPGPRQCRDSRAARALGGAPAPGGQRPAHQRGAVVETGSAREVHHFALLAGYGAEAIHPYSRSSPCCICKACCPRASTAARRSGTSSRPSARAC